ncbi:MAG: DEAD/DEAH box helicase [Candidatus Harrisonbacteria bacterium]|nr:DEAD/DEAH box helicase [Candidatus Harrisonbacteria bacterium]
MNQDSTPTFYGLGIAPKLLEVLTKKKFTTPTPIQQRSIPVALEGKDLVGIAQTGTGKTLAFGIPLLQHLAASEKAQGLILVPTRELAIQVEETLNSIGTPLGIKSAVIIGGANMRMQIQQLKRNPQLIIATPGRLLDHIQSRSVRLASVKVLVLDEADRMLDMGFAPQINKILAGVPKERQTMLFSATMPNEIVKIASQYMQLPLRVEVAPAGTAAEKVVHEVFFVPKQAKIQLLASLLKQYRGTVLVFVRTKHGAKKACRDLRAMDHKAAEIHGNRTLNQRKEALNGFKTGRYRVLVATDIAARGIDVSAIELVINFDLPTNSEDYVHRIGRTGRAGMAGRAISFATPEQSRDVRNIERLIRMALPVSKIPQDLPHIPKTPYTHPSASPRGRSPQHRQRRPFQRRRR